MKNLYLLLLLSVFGVIFFSCDKDKNESDIEGGCNLNNPVKNIIEATGTVWYDSQAKAFCIYTAIEGTIDSQDIGVVCNLPQSYKKDGLTILYTGNFYKCEEFKPLIPGQTYYYLDLDKVKLIP